MELEACKNRKSHTLLPERPVGVTKVANMPVPDPINPKILRKGLFGIGKKPPSPASFLKKYCSHSKSWLGQNYV